MVGCSIRNCKSRSVKGGSIKFFSFPTKESIANEWLRYCGSKTTTKNGRVCSKHFLQSDYINPLHQVLLNYAPRQVRQLKPDVIPTLQIDSIDEQNTSNVMLVEEVSEIVCTPDNVNCLSQYNTMPANEVVESSNVVEESEETISVSVAGYESLKGTANEFHPTHPLLAKNINNSIILLYTQRSPAPGDDSLKNGTSDNRNCLSQCDTVPAKKKIDEVVVYSKAVEKSEEPISVSRAEYQSLKRTADEFHVLKNNLEKIFTPGQIRRLMTPDKHRIIWSSEDIAAATSLRSISLKAYRHLKDTVGIPLPALSTLRNHKTKHE